MRKTRTAVLISGGGSNMMALVRAACSPDHPADIRLVLSSSPEAGGLAKAAAAGVGTETIDHKTFGKDRAAFDAALDACLQAHRIEFVALAGFMRILTPDFVLRWRGRIVNIHPSLLPRHKGLDTHARAIAAGDAEHGCTVHWVTPDLDAGAIIAQAKVDVLPGESEAQLAARVLAEEHALYPAALAAAIREADAAAQFSGEPPAALS